MAKAQHDVVIRGGQVYDGRGNPPQAVDVAIDGDRVTAIGPVAERGAVEIDATGQAVCPGFINMLSWAGEALLVDGRSQSEIRQGVTLEVMGEGRSMGPLNALARDEILEGRGDYDYDVTWKTLGEYLETLEQRGVSCNVASYVGATTLRINTVGYENRPPTEVELAEMRALARAAMAEGAVGVSTALVYSPAAYATTEELIGLCRVVAAAGGLYASHIRNEADGLFEALDEFLRIVRESGIRGEIYHLKASGRSNWDKLPGYLQRIEDARAAGLAVTADMYPYHASSSGLDGCMPPWSQEGGVKAWLARLQAADTRARVIAEMKEPSTAWDNFYTSAGSPENIMLVSFRKPHLKPLAGRTLADVAQERGKSAEETCLDLCIEDGGNVGAAFFSMSADNVRTKLAQPWMSFCSDAQSVSAEGVFLQRSPHPRTYGSFARVLGKYVREEQVVPLEEAIRRLTSFPAEVLRLKRRGQLAPGYFADIVVFDPQTVQDIATFAKPHQYATGVSHVLVNGGAVIRDGDHTGAMPGRVVRGPGYRG